MTGTSRGRKFLRSHQDTQTWIFLFPEEPDYRDFDAFDFVVTELNELTKSVGAAKASIQRNVLVERAIARAFPVTTSKLRSRGR